MPGLSGCDPGFLSGILFIDLGVIVPVGRPVERRGPGEVLLFDDIAADRKFDTAAQLFFAVVDQRVGETAGITHIDITLQVVHDLMVVSHIELQTVFEEIQFRTDFV